MGENGLIIEILDERDINYLIMVVPKDIGWWFGTVFYRARQIYCRTWCEQKKNVQQLSTHVCRETRLPLSKCRSGPPRMLAVGTDKNTQNQDSVYVNTLRQLTHNVKTHEITANGLGRNLAFVNCRCVMICGGEKENKIEKISNQIRWRGENWHKI